MGLVTSVLGTLTEAVLRPVGEHVLGIQFNDAMVESLKTELADRLRGRLGRPANHDIARAVRVAELQATEYLLRSHERLRGTFAKSGESVDQEDEPEARSGSAGRLICAMWQRMRPTLVEGAKAVQPADLTYRSVAERRWVTVPEVRR